MTIVEKVAKLLKSNKTMSLREIYDNLPEHSHASIRGNINRYLANAEEPEFMRTDHGIYSVIEIIAVTPTKNGSVVDYSASYYNGEQEIHFYHENVTMGSSLKEGIYSRTKEFEDFAAMENPYESIRGIFQSAKMSLLTCS